MTKAELIKEICKREGKRSQVSIGNVREIISISRRARSNSRP